MVVGEATGEDISGCKEEERVFFIAKMGLQILGSISIGSIASGRAYNGGNGGSRVGKYIYITFLFFVQGMQYVLT